VALRKKLLRSAALLSGNFQTQSQSAKGNRPVYKRIMIASMLFLFFAPVRGNAQRFNGYAGVSYSSYGPDLSVLRLSPTTPNRLYGWNGSVEVKMKPEVRLRPVLGLVGDFSGHYGTETVGSVFFCKDGPFAPCWKNENVSFYTITGGPQVSVSLGRFRPYAHALFGVALFRDVVQVSPETGESFAQLFGGGIDVLVGQGAGWRVQADDVQTSRSSLRVSTGIVFRF
jgi:hypothetical protein